MLQRLKTAIPLILIVALAFLLPGTCGAIFFIALSIAMMSCACHEMYSMLQLPHSRAFQLCTTCATGMLLLLTPFAGNFNATLIHAVEVVFICAFFLCTVLIVFKHGPTRPMVDAMLASLGIFIYAGWTLLFIAKLYFLGGCSGRDGRELIIFLIAVTKMADVGAYIVGSNSAKLPSGNHKLAPVLSPKKSWEGLLGGTLFSTATAIGLSYIPALVDFNGKPMFNIWEAAVFGLAASVIGLLGDLAESAVKRAANVKDSGKIPGIGGILDVLDSLIPIAPLFYAYIIIKLF